MFVRFGGSQSTAPSVTSEEQVAGGAGAEAEAKAEGENAERGEKCLPEERAEHDATAAVEEIAEGTQEEEEEDDDEDEGEKIHTQRRTHTPRRVHSHAQTHENEQNRNPLIHRLASLGHAPPKSKMKCATRWVGHAYFW